MKRLITLLFLLLPVLLWAAPKYVGDFTGNGNGPLGPVTNIPYSSITNPRTNFPASAITNLSSNVVMLQTNFYQTVTNRFTLDSAGTAAVNGWYQWNGANGFTNGGAVYKATLFDDGFGNTDWEITNGAGVTLYYTDEAASPTDYLRFPYVWHNGSGFLVSGNSAIGASPAPWGEAGIQTNATPVWTGSAVLKNLQVGLDNFLLDQDPLYPGAVIGGFQNVERGFDSVIIAGHNNTNYGIGNAIIGSAGVIIKRSNGEDVAIAAENSYMDNQAGVSAIIATQAATNKAFADALIAANAGVTIDQGTYNVAAIGGIGTYATNINSGFLTEDYGRHTNDFNLTAFGRTNVTTGNRNVFVTGGRNLVSNSVNVSVIGEGLIVASQTNLVRLGIGTGAGVLDITSAGLSSFTAPGSNYFGTNYVVQLGVNTAPDPAWDLAVGRMIAYGEYYVAGKGTYADRVGVQTNANNTAAPFTVAGKSDLSGDVDVTGTIRGVGGLTNASLSNMVFQGDSPVFGSITTTAAGTSSVPDLRIVNSLRGSNDIVLADNNGLIASALTGTIADARLSTNVALLNTNNAFSVGQRFLGTTNTYYQTTNIGPVSVIYPSNLVLEPYFSTVFVTNGTSSVHTDIVVSAGIVMHGTNGVNLSSWLTADGGGAQAQKNDWLAGTLQNLPAPSAFNPLTCYGNFFAGQNAGGGVSNAVYNVGVGLNALYTLRDGNGNSGIGVDGFSSLTNGRDNQWSGHGAGGGIYSGSDNIAIGVSALSGGGGNVKRALNQSIGIGSSAGTSNTYDGNIFIGYDAGSSFVDDKEATIIGWNAGSSGGYRSAYAGFHGTTLIGAEAGRYERGRFNTAVGYNALRASSGLPDGSDYNTALGVNAGVFITGGNNTAAGASALGGGNGTSTSVSGTDNTAVGLLAGANILTGIRNTFIGSGASSSAGVTAIQNATAIGYGAIVNSNNWMQLGNSSLTNIDTYASIRASGTGTFSNGVASLATSTYTITATGYTNSGTKCIRVMGLTGVSIVQTNATSGFGFSRGTITVPTDILLQPNSYIIGTTVAAQAAQDF